MNATEQWEESKKWKVCGNCRFWTCDRGDEGRCKRFPPPAPLSYSTDECGEFQPRLEVVEKPEVPENPGILDGLEYYRGEFYESGRAAARSGKSLSAGPNPESAEGIDWVAGWIDRSRECLAKIGGVS